MLFFDGFGSLIMLGLWIFCFIDVVVTPEAACRNLPKLGWVFIVLLLPLVGSIGWLVAGRPWDRSNVPARSSRPKAGSRYSASERPNRRPATNPDDDEEFLAGLRRRADEQRRRAAEQQRREQDGKG